MSSPAYGATLLYTQTMSNDKVRSVILETGNPKVKSALIAIEATPSTIFAILSNPKRHKDIDGSATVTANVSGPDVLVLGSKFGMKMRLGVTYWIRNTVVEYKKNELIAWRHLGRWRWRYELVDLGNGSTQVTETFDGTTAPALAQTWLNFRKAYPWTQLAVAKSLVRLKAAAESQ
jgi:hypothetical protein